MASFVSSSFVLLLVTSLLELGSSKPQHFIGVGNRFFIVKNPAETGNGNVPSMPIMLAKASTNPSTSGQIYVLRRKTPGQSNQYQLPKLTGERQTNFYQQHAPTSSFSFPILSPGQNQNRRNMETENSDMNSKWKSLEQAIKNVYTQDSYMMRPGTVFGTDSPTLSGIAVSHPNEFRSNIPLPQNPFLPSPPLSTYGNIMVERSDTPMENYDNYYHPPAELPQAEEGLQNMLNKYLEDMYRSKTEDARTSPNIVYNLNSFEKDTSRADTGFPSYEPYEQNRGSHYSKTGSSSLTDSYSYSQEPFLHEAESRDAFGHISHTSVLEKKSHYHHNEVFPPTGSYTPYGERTILMVKYPGMPENKRPGYNTLYDDYQFEGKRPFSFKNILNPYKNNPKFPVNLTPKAPDFGVVVSQNFILQPSEGPGPSTFQTNDDGESSNPGNLVSQLAKALAERNRIINAYSSSPLANGKSVDKKPPFVLVHLESVTKKSNKTGRFGFNEDEVDKNYSNGTIIYPTKDNPDILASTQFEFENIADVVFLFDRPLEGYHDGQMKPIVPVGIEDIKMFLKLVYEVHRDVHDGGKKKVADLMDLSGSLDKEVLFGSKPMDASRTQFPNDNWMHTSSIGLRSLG